MKITLLYPTIALAVCVLFLGCDREAEIEREYGHWEYENTDWENLGYGSCAGNSQSPINIETLFTVPSSDLPEVSYNYTPFEMRIVDNGHTIQVNGPGENVSVTYNDVAYEFVQFHFHRLSEHQINTSHTAMELHVVHQDENGNLLVLGYMIEPGSSNPFLQAVFNHIPEEEKVEIATGITIDLTTIQPNNKNYYTYSGSLTTPPCTAAVQFVIFKETMQADPQQIELFASYYNDNYRPVQPLNNRFVLEKID